MINVRMHARIFNFRYIAMIDQTIDSLQDAPLYSFDNLVSEFKWLVNSMPDPRIGNNKSYSIADAALGAFAVFFMQSPSFLSHQLKMQAAKGYNNAKSLFQIEKIPSDSQLRSLLDPIAPENITLMFDNIFNGLNSVGYFEHYRTINKNILIALDGVNYFSSYKINCEQCIVQKQGKNKIRYTHNAITPVIVAPNNPRVISLTPEFITPQDGYEKQDCEHAAAKRWLEAHGSKYKEVGATILGDDLYASQAICEVIQQQGLHFIFTCLPESHVSLYKAINNLELNDQIGNLQVTRYVGKNKLRTFIDQYRFINGIPVRKTADALNINWCELITIDQDGQIVDTRSYITDHEITAINVAKIIECGRTRWKIENENNNTLKNHGYNLEHNFGHGKQYLSQLLLTFNLLAFLCHTGLSIMDTKYQKLREKLPTRKIFFEHIKTLTMYLYFDNWDAMLQFMLDGLEKRFLATSLEPIAQGVRL